MKPFAVIKHLDVINYIMLNLLGRHLPPVLIAAIKAFLSRWNEGARPFVRDFPYQLVVG
jgi:hypothetical protein